MTSPSCTTSDVAISDVGSGGESPFSSRFPIIVVESAPDISCSLLMEPARHSSCMLVEICLLHLRELLRSFPEGFLLLGESLNHFSALLLQRL